jgi:serine/threonine protein kinase
VLVDFGAAKVALNSSTTATVIGSLDYTAPEQLRGKPTFASDLYSLGMYLHSTADQRCSTNRVVLRSAGCLDLAAISASTFI